MLYQRGSGGVTAEQLLDSQMDYAQVPEPKRRAIELDAFYSKAILNSVGNLGDKTHSQLKKHVAEYEKNLHKRRQLMEKVAKTVEQCKALMEGRSPNGIKAWKPMYEGPILEEKISEEALTFCKLEFKADMDWRTAKTHLFQRYQAMNRFMDKCMDQKKVDELTQALSYNSFKDCQSFSSNHLAVLAEEGLDLPEELFPESSILQITKAKAASLYKTVMDNYAAAKIKMKEEQQAAESRKSKALEKLGKLKATELWDQWKKSNPKSPANVAGFDVEFAINDGGVLEPTLADTPSAKTRPAAKAKPEPKPKNNAGGAPNNAKRGAPKGLGKGGGKNPATHPTDRRDNIGGQKGGKGSGKPSGSKGKGKGKGKKGSNGK